MADVVKHRTKHLDFRIDFPPVSAPARLVGWWIGWLVGHAAGGLGGWSLVALLLALLSVDPLTCRVWAEGQCQTA